MKAKKIDIIKDWPDFKSIRNIQVFLTLPIFIIDLFKALIE